nr:unnamed protein product [Digitaria exilis]
MVDGGGGSSSSCKRCAPDTPLYAMAIDHLKSSSPAGVAPPPPTPSESPLGRLDAERLEQLGGGAREARRAHGSGPATCGRRPRRCTRAVEALLVLTLDRRVAVAEEVAGDAVHGVLEQGDLDTGAIGDFKATGDVDAAAEVDAEVATHAAADADTALRARAVGERVADSLTASLATEQHEIADVDPELLHGGGAQHEVADVDPELLHGGGAERHNGVVEGYLALPGAFSTKDALSMPPAPQSSSARCPLEAVVLVDLEQLHRAAAPRELEGEAAIPMRDGDRELARGRQRRRGKKGW